MGKERGERSGQGEPRTELSPEEFDRLMAAQGEARRRRNAERRAAGEKPLTVELAPEIRAALKAMPNMHKGKPLRDPEFDEVWGVDAEEQAELEALLQSNEKGKGKQAPAQPQKQEKGKEMVYEDERAAQARRLKEQETYAENQRAEQLRGLQKQWNGEALPLPDDSMSPQMKNKFAEQERKKKLGMQKGKLGKAKAKAKPKAVFEDIWKEGEE